MIRKKRANSKLLKALSWGGDSKVVFETVRDVQSIDQAVGRVLRDMRQACKVSQDTVAKALGTGRTSITNIELGNQSVSLEMLDQFWHLFEVAPWEILKQAYVLIESEENGK